MRVGEIIREGPMTVEVRSAGVGGGEAEDEALREAAQRGNLNKVRRLLAAGANVNSTGEDGLTPLHQSARAGHERVSRMLVDAGANVRATDNGGKTPIDWAKEFGHRAVLDLLSWTDVVSVIVSGAVATAGLNNRDSPRRLTDPLAAGVNLPLPRPLDTRNITTLHCTAPHNDTPQPGHASC